MPQRSTMETLGSFPFSSLRTGREQHVQSFASTATVTFHNETDHITHATHTRHTTRNHTTPKNNNTENNKKEIKTFTLSKYRSWMPCFLFISRHYPPSVMLPPLEVTAVSTESPDSLFTFYQQFYHESSRTQPKLEGLDLCDTFML